MKNLVDFISDPINEGRHIDNESNTILKNIYDALESANKKWGYEIEGELLTQLKNNFPLMFKFLDDFIEHLHRGKFEEGCKNLKLCEEQLHAVVESLPKVKKKW